MSPRKRHREIFVPQHNTKHTVEQARESQDMNQQRGALHREQLKRLAQPAFQIESPQHHQNQHHRQQQQQQQQQYRDAQIARAKLNARKSFSLEDDLEFYPNHIDLRQPKSHQHFVQQHQIPYGQTSHSPYTTPTKINGMRLNTQNHSGFLSPQTTESASHQNLFHHGTAYGSPAAMRRLDHLNVTSNSPMYSGNTRIQW